MSDYTISGDVNCADFIGGDKNVTYGFSPEDVECLIGKVLGFMDAGGVFLPDQSQPDVLQIEHNGEKLRFRPGAARRLTSQSMERAYLLALTVDQEYQRWATRFVPLAGKMDVRQVIEGLPISFTEFVIPTCEAGMGVQPTQKPLKDITEAMQNHGAFVILGEPGAGKTTTMQKVAFDMAHGLLKKNGGRVPLFVRLSQQGERDPYAFLQVEWERRTGLPFAKSLGEGRILILADGINEIPRDKRNERLNAWMLFENQYRGANQLVFSGREKDYDNQLNLPRVLVEPLDEERVHEFLQKHKAEGLAELLDDPASKLDEMARNPLNLFVLVMVYLRGGKNLQVLANRGRLFQSFTLELMAHEQLWHPDSLSVDTKTDLFARLAYDMQKQGSGTTFPIDSARECLPADLTTSLGERVGVDRDAVLRFGRGASILDPATVPDIRFYHHLLQEYFAARELLRRFNSGKDLSAFWKTPRTQEEMPPADIGEWDPLPEPPTTGWEVTTILACGLSSDPAKLIEAVRLHNPALAGRCLDEAGLPPLYEGEENSEGEVREKVQKDLLSDLYNPSIHLRARLQSGFILGRIGDPRFQMRVIKGVKVILPRMVHIPGGKYLIGSEESDEQSYADEKPRHAIEIESFLIGKWPVTNAEFAHFIEDGGYKNSAYWSTELSKKWLHMEDFPVDMLSDWLRLWEKLNADPDWLVKLESSGNYSKRDLDNRKRIASLSRDEFIKEVIEKTQKNKSRLNPQHWYNPSRNNPSQPVVGITWFEANAYCAWLSHLTDKTYRLPREVEWEIAARGNSNYSYPWGDIWMVDSSNTIESRILGTSPVGAFSASGNVSIFGVEEVCGNVWNWTQSLYLNYPYQPANAENMSSPKERVAKAGSWDYGKRMARIQYRNTHSPLTYSQNYGFRIVCEE
jgi:formylglycine-generating enzyme required for sulfatase activity